MGTSANTDGMGARKRNSLSILPPPPPLPTWLKGEGEEADWAEFQCLLPSLLLSISSDYDLPYSSARNSTIFMATKRT